MATEVWFRNPHNYIRELVECGIGNIAWDRGTLHKKRIDPIKHAQLYYGQAIPWRLLLVGEQGTVEYRPGHDADHPVGVYPTWAYGDDAAFLEEMCAKPLGRDIAACGDFSLPVDERPVLGQEHRVVVIEPPPASTGPGRAFLRYLKELQEEYPDCILHVHGLYGWRVAFGMGFRSADVEPRTSAHKGKVIVPAGREMTYEQAQKHPQWIRSLGFKAVDLSIPRVRCMYNIKSAVWAGTNYAELNRFGSINNGSPVDIETPDDRYVPVQTSNYKPQDKKFVEGDKQLCNICSLQLDCKYYREGAVCSVPGAEPAPLARFFKTRDSGLIIDGLSTIMAAQTRRLERGMKAEEVFDELDPEVTKLLNSLFDQGVKLAKLVDPGLRASPTKVGVFVNGQSQPQQQDQNPRVFVANIVRSLEAQGIPRDQITPDMIQETFAAMNNTEGTQRAIEGQVIAHDEGQQSA